MTLHLFWKPRYILVSMYRCLYVCENCSFNFIYVTLYILHVQARENTIAIVFAT